MQRANGQWQPSNDGDDAIDLDLDLDAMLAAAASLEVESDPNTLWSNREQRRSGPAIEQRQPAQQHAPQQPRSSNSTDEDTGFELNLTPGPPAASTAPAVSRAAQPAVVPVAQQAFVQQIGAQQPVAPQPAAPHVTPAPQPAVSPLHREPAQVARPQATERPTAAHPNPRPVEQPTPPPQREPARPPQQESHKESQPANKPEERQNPNVVTTSCSRCSRVVRANRRLLGQTVKCPKCSAPITIDDGTARVEPGAPPEGKDNSTSKALIAAVDAALGRTQPPPRADRELTESLRSRRISSLAKLLLPPKTGEWSRPAIEAASEAISELCAARDSRAVPTVAEHWSKLPMGVRVHALRHLPELGDFAAFPLLVTNLLSQDEALLRNAIIGLGTLGDRRAVEPLMMLAVDTAAHRIRCLDAVCKLGDAAFPVLVGMLEDHSDVSIRHTVLEALGRCGNARAIPAMSRFLQDKSLALRRHAAEMIARISDARAAGVLAGVLTDHDETVRLSAVRSILRTPDPRFAPALLPLLNDPADEVRLAAIEALGECGERSCVDALRPFVDDPDDQIAMVACEALGRLGDEASVSLLIDRLEAAGEIPDQQPLVLRLIDALRRIGDERASLPLVNISLHPSHRVRVRAAEAMGRLKDPAIRPALEEMLRCDLMDEVKAAAARALGEVGDAESAPALLRYGLADSSSVRVQTLIALGRLKPAGLAAQIEPFAQDRAPQVRYQIATLLGELGDQLAVPTLDELAFDEDDMVQRAARKSLATLGVERTDADFDKLARKRGKKSSSRSFSQLSTVTPRAATGRKKRIGFRLLDLVPSSLAGAFSLPSFSLSGLKELDLDRLDGIPGGKLTIAGGVLMVLGAVYFAIQSGGGPVTHSSTPPRGYVADLATSADGKVIAAARTRSMVELWNADTKQLTAQLPKLPSTWVAMNADGSKLIAGSPSQLTLVDVNAAGEATQQTPLTGHAGEITAFTSSASGDYVATVDFTGEVIRWSLSAGGEAKRIDLGLKGKQAKLRAISLSPDGQLFAAAVPEGPVTVWNIDANSVVAEFPVGVSPVSAVAFSPSAGRVVAAVGEVNPSLAAWRVDAPRSKPTMMQSSLVEVNHLSFQSETLLTATSTGPAGEVWDLDAVAMRPFSSAVEIFAFSPVGTDLFAVGDDDKPTIYVYDVAGKLSFELNEGA
ncbi:MAG: HEAT repeat domain-containing protein [Planctomycetaceae bacterium]